MKFIFTIGFSVLLFSCSSSLKEDCENRKTLLSGTENIPELAIDFNQTKTEMELFIRSNIPMLDPKANVKFLLDINDLLLNTSIHSPHINQFACYGMPAMQHKSPQLSVILNEKDQIVMEGKDLISIDSIPGYISWYYPHDRPFGEKIVHLECLNRPKASSVEKVIKNIASGYELYYEKKAQQLFQKRICLLDSVELSQVGKKYPFELRLWIGDNPPLPFPPVNSAGSVDV